MAEEIKKTEELKKDEETAAQDAQKLDDEAMDAVAGGKWNSGKTTVGYIPAPEPTAPKQQKL